ncbi:hypothetical protein HYU16_00880 [Candidatus Woesearchaeota archaeon]|nr:hypothetical protein [Candidatus Woesearchaeota archaeon]
MKMEEARLGNLRLVCECGENALETQLVWKGIKVRAWKCRKCGEELINPVDAQRALEIDRARKNRELTVKLRRVGKSAVITMPQVLKEIYHIKEGRKVEWNVEGEDKFSISVI